MENAADDNLSQIQRARPPAPDKGLLEKKAWEASIVPLQSLGMNMFMLWMSGGGNAGIFGIMMMT